jgi:hypothetical protein
VLLCITPSPAIDRTAHVERIVPDEVLRPVELVALAGGTYGYHEAVRLVPHMAEHDDEDALTGSDYPSASASSL